MTTHAVPNTEEVQLLIPAGFAQGLLNYLSRQPYGDVFTMIDALRSLPRAVMAPKAEPKKVDAPAPDATSAPSPAVALASEGT